MQELIGAGVWLRSRTALLHVPRAFPPRLLFFMSALRLSLTLRACSSHFRACISAHCGLIDNKAAVTLIWLPLSQVPQLHGHRAERAQNDFNCCPRHCSLPHTVVGTLMASCAPAIILALVFSIYCGLIDNKAAVTCPETVLSNRGCIDTGLHLDEYTYCPRDFCLPPATRQPWRLAVRPDFRS